MAARTLEILYFDGCPGHEQLLPVLRELADRHDLEVMDRRVESGEDAERERFLGSPSIRVEGIDVEPGAQDRTDFGLRCRLYQSSDGVRPLPPQKLIERALRR